MIYRINKMSNQLELVLKILFILLILSMICAVPYGRTSETPLRLRF